MARNENQEIMLEIYREGLKDKRAELQNRMKSLMDDLTYHSGRLEKGEKILPMGCAERGVRIDQLIAEIAAEEKLLFELFGKG
jgi:hypothetical protein